MEQMDLLFLFTRNHRGGVCMSKLELRFWFEQAGPCIWAMNHEAKVKYGYPIDPERLPISDSLIRLLNNLMKEYATYLDWDDPGSPSPWTKEQKIDFLCRANKAYEQLKNELGAEYEINNEAAYSVGLGPVRKLPINWWELTQR